MNVTWEYGEKPNFGLDFGLLDQIWASKMFCGGF